MKWIKKGEKIQKEIKIDKDGLLEKQSIKNLLNQYCITIDNRGTKAMDDAISIESF